MKILSLTAVLWCCVMSAGAEAEDTPLPELMRRLQGDLTVIPAVERAVPNAVKPGQNMRPLRDPKVQTVIAGKADQEAKELKSVKQAAQEESIEQPEDVSKPPLPDIGAPLSEEAEISSRQIVLEPESPAVRMPPKSDQKAVANPRITVIDGKYLKSYGTGKDLSVEVKREHDYEQFYSYSFNFQNIPSELVEKLQFSALDLALEYKKPEADLKELEQRLTELLRSQGLLYARAQLVDDPQKYGSKLVMINLQGMRLNRVIINNHSSRVSNAALQKSFASLKPGGFLLKKPLEKAVADFNAKRTARADFNLRQSGQAGKADLVITVFDLPQR